MIVMVTAFNYRESTQYYRLKVSSRRIFFIDDKESLLKCKKHLLKVLFTSQLCSVIFFDFIVLYFVIL